jgi:radical SAM protein with 4Fe4S-binding SPASM domain
MDHQETNSDWNDFPNTYLVNKVLQMCTGRNTEADICSIVGSERSLEAVILRTDIHALISRWLEQGHVSASSDGRLRLASPFATTVVAKRANVNIGITRLLWDVTRRCNLECRHCYANHSHLGDELSEEEMSKTLDQVAKLAPYLIVFGGGEPFTCEPFVRLLSTVKRRTGSRVKILTNGTLLSSADIQALRENVDFLQFSLDGTEEHHDFLRNRPGAFKKVVDAITHARTAGIPSGVCMTLYRDNVGDIDWMIGFALTHGLFKVRISPIVAAGRALNNLSLCALSAAESRKLYQKLAELRIRYKDVLLLDFRDELYGQAFLSTAVTERPDEHKDYLMCAAGRSILYINPEGNVTPCNFIDYPEHFVGNVREDDLVQIWQRSPMLRAWRQLKVEQISPCRDCLRRHLCGGGLRCNAIARTGALNGRDPFCHFYEQDTTAIRAAEPEIHSLGEIS